MADPERTMLDRADVGPVVAPAGHSHEDLSQGLAGKADKTHADSHAEGGSDRITPESIGAADLYAISRTGSQEDVNTFTEPGTYLLATSATNIPHPVTGYLEVIRRNGTLILQRYSAASGSTDGRQWIRNSYDGSTWTQWRPSGPTQAVEVGAVPLTRPDAVDADASIASGTYRVIRAQVTNMATFPAEWTSTIGYLTSWELNTNAYVRQTFVSQFGDQVWSRAKYGTWGPWKRLVTSDDPRLRDTGLRNVTSLIQSPITSGNIYLQRVGDRVRITFNAVVLPAGSGQFVFFQSSNPIPDGFKKQLQQYRADEWMGSSSNTSNAPLAWLTWYGYNTVAYVGKNMEIGGTRTTYQIDGAISVTTNDPWPTVLPGDPA